MSYPDAFSALGWSLVRVYFCAARIVCMAARDAFYWLSWRAGMLVWDANAQLRQLEER